MFHTENEFLAELIVLTPKLARKKFRQSIFEAWKWNCAYCEKQLCHNTATIDHIVPKHKGGHNSRNNLACCCCSCNSSKGSQKLDLWYTEDNPKYTKERADKIKEWTEQKPKSLNLAAAHQAIPYICEDAYVGWIAT